MEPNARTVLNARLFDAVGNNDAMGVTAALDAGADPNARDEDEGYTPLHLATDLAGPNVFRALIKAGADPNARDSFESTPLHRVINSGPEHTMVLLCADADPLAKDAIGLTPIDLARDNPQSLALLDQALAAGVIPAATRDKVLKDYPDQFPHARVAAAAPTVTLKWARPAPSTDRGMDI